MDVNFTNALSAGLVLGVMIIPTIASLAEDALTAVPRALRQGSFAMGANRMQTTLRVVLPAALSGVAAAVVLGLSRAIGETMIVALAAGGQKNLSADPREGMQTMTGFIAQTAGGENPVGSTVLQHPLRGRAAAVRHHPGHQHRQHRAGPSVQAGLLMSASRHHRRSQTPSGITTGRSRERSVGLDHLPRRALVLPVLRGDGARRAGRRHAVVGAPRFDADLITNYDSTLFPETDRIPGRHPRQHLADADDGPARRTARHRRGPLPRGVRRQRHLVQPADRGEPAEPRRRAVGRSTACWPSR